MAGYAFGSNSPTGSTLAIDHSSHLLRNSVTERANFERLPAKSFVRGACITDKSPTSTAPQQTKRSPIRFAKPSSRHQLTTSNFPAT
jgi:hypothetical protein